MKVCEGSDIEVDGYTWLDGGAAVTGELGVGGTVIANRILLKGGSIAFPAIGWLDDDDGSGTGFYRVLANRIGIVTGGAIRWEINNLGALTAGAITSTINMGNSHIFSSSQLLELGGNMATTTHGLGTGDVGVAGALEVDGAAFFDGSIDAYGTLQVHGQSLSVLPAILTPTGTTQTIDWDDGNAQILDLESATGDVTVTLINEKAGGSYIIEIRQDSATPRDIVWPASVLFAGGIVPVISVGANAVDVMSLFFNDVSFLANIGQDFS